MDSCAERDTACFEMGWKELGDDCFERKDYESAIQYYSREIQDTPHESRSYGSRSLSYSKLGLYSEALRDAKAAIERDPQWSTGYFRAGIALFGLREFEASTTFFSMACELNPENVQYQSFLESVRQFSEAEATPSPAPYVFPSVSHYDSAENVPLPVTVLSGFLGSGKTTLLKRILSEHHNMKIAVIVNDMAEVNVDANLIESTSLISSDERLVRMQNGCICCTLREDLLSQVFLLSRSGEFDYLVIESTGISEPLPVAQTFMFEDVNGISLQQWARLDTLVTVVDASRLLLDVASHDCLRDRNWEAHEGDQRNIANLIIDQIEFADVIVLNKMDLVINTMDPPSDGSDDPSCDQLEHLIRRLNPHAAVYRTSYSDVPIENILNTKKFSFEQALQHPGWLEELRSVHTPETQEYGISSFVFRDRRPLDVNRLRAKISSGCFHGILRSKGFFYVAQAPSLALEWSSSGPVFHINPLGVWKSACETDSNMSSATNLPEIISQNDDHNDETIKFGDRRQEIVFIGISISESEIYRVLEECLLTDEEISTACPDSFSQLSDASPSDIASTLKDLMETFSSTFSSF